MSDEWTDDDFEEPPVCPGCKAVAFKPKGWLTTHEQDCSWLNDPDAEPYS